MQLRDFMGYLKTVNSQSEEIPLVVSDTTFLDSNLMSNLDYVPGSAGTGGGDKFYHHTRYPWAGAGPLADALNSISTEDTPRWSHFFVGPASGGASFQTRCSLFTTVTDGSQLLLAFPPAQPAFGSAYSSEHPLEWMREVNANSPEVLQGGGPQLSSPLVRIRAPLLGLFRVGRLRFGLALTLCACVRRPGLRVEARLHSLHAVHVDDGEP